LKNSIEKALVGAGVVLSSPRMMGFLAYQASTLVQIYGGPLIGTFSRKDMGAYVN